MTAMTPRRAYRKAADLFARFASDSRGATAIEYGLIVALIFLAIISAVRSYTNSTSVMYSEISDAL